MVPWGLNILTSVLATTFGYTVFLGHGMCKGKVMDKLFPYLVTIYFSTITSFSHYLFFLSVFLDTLFLLLFSI